MRNPTIIKKNKQKKKSLSETLRERLSGSQFRWINEQMYTATGKESFELIKSDPELFIKYHDGFKTQVEKWPINPVDLFIDFLKGKPKNWTIADFGCGEAAILKKYHGVFKNIWAIDLSIAEDVKDLEGVIACDMANTPIKTESVDVAVFCLSLMGTDWEDFIAEANRVLKNGGILKIAEVKSRFTDIKKFKQVLKDKGFLLKEMKDVSKMFVEFELIKKCKTEKQSRRTEILKPCLYKKR